MNNKDEIALYELLGILKEVLIEIQEEAESDRDWSIVISSCNYALSQFED